MVSNGSYVFDSNNADMAARLVFASRFFQLSSVTAKWGVGGVEVGGGVEGDKVSGPKNARVILLAPSQRRSQQQAPQDKHDGSSWERLHSLCVARLPCDAATTTTTTGAQTSLTFHNCCAFVSGLAAHRFHTAVGRVCPSWSFQRTLAFHFLTSMTCSFLSKIWQHNVDKVRHTETERPKKMESYHHYE